MEFWFQGIHFFLPLRPVRLARRWDQADGLLAVVVVKFSYSAHGLLEPAVVRWFAGTNQEI